MEIIQGCRPDAAGKKLSIYTLDSVRSLVENLRKKQIVVRMGHGGGRGTPTPLE
jgi:hypothetical protein